MAKHSNKAYFLSFITILVDVIGLGSNYTRGGLMIWRLTGERLSQDLKYGGGLIFLFCSEQFLFSPITGLQSFRIDLVERPVFAFSLFRIGSWLVFICAGPQHYLAFVGRMDCRELFGASFTTAPRIYRRYQYTGKSVAPKTRFDWTRLRRFYYWSAVDRDWLELSLDPGTF